MRSEQHPTDRLWREKLHYLRTKKPSMPPSMTAKRAQAHEPPFARVSHLGMKARRARASNGRQKRKLHCLEMGAAKIRTPRNCRKTASDSSSRAANASKLQSKTSPTHLEGSRAALGPEMVLISLPKHVSKQPSSSTIPTRYRKKQSTALGENNHQRRTKKPSMPSKHVRSDQKPTSRPTRAYTSTENVEMQHPVCLRMSATGAKTWNERL
jgi:hypothetical protein